MHARYLTPIAIASLLCLGACDGALVTSDESAIFTLDEYHHEASKDDLLVIVRGGLPGVDQPTLARYVVDQMQGADWGPHARFTASPGPDVDKMFSYVMMIDGPADITAAELCAKPAQPQPMRSATTGEVTLVASLCRYNETMLGVSGRVSGAKGLDNPALSRLIADATQELTRPRRTNPFGGNESDETQHTP